MPIRRRQAHCVLNRNRRAAAERRSGSQKPKITLCPSVDNFYDGNGRLKVVPVREFSPNVPFEMTEGKFSYEDASNPVNQLGPVVEQCVPVSTSNDFASFMAAFNKRSNYCSEDDIEDDVFEESVRLIKSLPDLFDEWEENEVDRQRWIDKFDDGKRSRMTEAWRNIPWANPAYLGTKDLSVKQEILIKRDDPTWAPRIIYAGNDEFNACTGPASMVVMERAVALTNSTDVGPVRCKFAYKTNDVELVSHIRDDEFPEIVEGDYSSNDKFQKKRVAHIYDCWLRKLRMPSWFRSLLFELEEYKVQNRRFGVTAKLKYQLPTGTTSTTPRNSLYNLTMFTVACVRQRRKARCLILGDDLLAAMDRRLRLEGWISDVARFKMVLKAKAPALEGQATFLSRRIFAGVEVGCMVPLIGKMLVRFNCRGTMNEACSDSQYMAGKALSYAYECRHVPFLRDYFLERYAMEDSAAITLDDLTWFARTSGVDLSNIVQAIKDEKHLVDDDTFEYWLCCTYDGATLYELRELMDSIVLSAEQVVLDCPNIAFFMSDLG